jgi:superfamily II DNA or RNA helicase
MSYQVSLESLSDEVREKISDELTIEVETSKYSQFFNAKPKTLELYDLNNDNVILPFSYAVNTLKLKKPKSDTFAKMNVDCIYTGNLRENQVSIKDEAINNLNKYGACLISCYPGFGKTSTSIYIASKIKLRTLIILNRLMLMDQWIEAIKKFCPNAKITTLKPSNKKNDISNSDFVIINAINIQKFGEEFFKSIGVVIVDEAHLIMSQVLSQSLKYIFPKYVIGLSATPYRPDGLNALMTFYFTEHKIIRDLKRNHTVYKVETGFTPEVEYDRNGKVIWGKILEGQCSNMMRNNLIVDIVTKFNNRNFLVLSKRVEQAEFIYKKLKEKGENVSLLIKSETVFDKNDRILIGTTGKVGVGFDHDKLDALILASDLEEYFIQYLGRVFRRTDVEPIIFDLVDNNSILKKHFSTRKKVYTDVGGKIVNYKND